MVFERVITNLLNTYLSEFIDDLSANQLKVGALRGDVHINNLAIKGNALDTFNLPFRVVYGHIGSFIARIPWVSLYTSPVCFDIQKVFIVCVPNPESKYDPEIERKLIEVDKRKQLEKIEEAMKKAAINFAEKESQKGDDFVTKLIAQIVKNIEIRLTNVHMCYEDRFSNAKLPFALGFTLHKMSFITKDVKDLAKSKSESTKEEENFIKKDISLECFSIYWNCSNRLELMSSRTETEIDEILLDGIASHERTPSHLNYILIPNNFSANAIINRKPKEDNFNIPVVKVDMLLDQFSLNLDRKQFESFVMLLDALNRMKIAQAYRKWRPSKGIKGNSQSWWKFAITSIIETEIKRKAQNWSWPHIKEHRNLLKKYKKAYKEKILNQNDSKLVQDLESKLDVFNIIMVRSHADFEVHKEKEKIRTQEQPKGWFNWLWGSSKPEPEVSESKPIIEEFKKEITSEEKAKLYEAIGYEEGLPTDYPLEFVAQLFSVNLKKIQLTIQGDRENESIVQFGLFDVTSELGFRPASSGLYMISKIRDISMLGCRENPMIMNESRDSDLLNLQVELNPIDKKYDYSIDFSTKGINFIFDSPTINSILEMAIPPNDISLDHIQALAEIKLQEIKMMSATGLEYAIDQHKKLKINVNIKPSFLIVPDHGDLSHCHNVLLLSCGHMKIVSELKESGKIIKQRSQDRDDQSLILVMREGVYEKYILSLSQVQMIVSTHDTWSHDLLQSRKNENTLISERHFLRPFDIDLAFLRSIIMDDPDIASFKIEGAIPSIYFKAKDDDLFRLMDVVFSIPVPEFNKSAVDSAKPDVKSSSVQGARAARDALKFAHSNIIKDEMDALSPHIQLTKLVANFSVQEFTCDLRNSSNQRLLLFSLKKIGASLTMKTFGMSANLYLGQILADVFDTHKSDDIEVAPFKLIETDKNENVLRLLYNFCDKNSPTFENIVQKVNIELSKVKCTIDESILDELLFLAQRLLKSLPQSEAPEVPEESLKRRLSSASQSSKTGLTKNKKKHKSSTLDITKIITLGGVACIESVVIVINNICSITFEGLRCDLNTFQSGFLTCGVRWNQFLICNDIAYGLNKQKSAIHPHIIKSESEKVLEMQISMYPESYSRQSIDNVDLKITIHFGRLKIVFLNEFVLKLGQFLDIFQVAKQKAIAASSIAADYAKQTALVAYESAYKMGLDIILEAPIITVPQSWQSKICLHIDLGKIAITNNLKKLHHMLMDQIVCELTDTKISMIDQTHDKNFDNILDPITFEMKLNRNLSFETNKSEPEISLSAHFQDIKLKMSQVNVSTFYKILDENINAGFQALEAAKKHSNKPQTQVVVVENQLERRSKVPAAAAIISSTIVEEAEEDETEKEETQKAVFIRQSCSFSLPRIEVLLYNGEAKKDLNKFTDAYLLDFEFFANIYTNFDISASLNIRDIVLCDARATRKETGFKKLMYSKIETNDGKMMRINFIKKKDIVLDVNMSGFTLIFALDYLLQLSSLFAFTVDNKSSEIEKVAKPRPVSTISPSKLADHAKAISPAKPTVSKPESEQSITIATFKMSKGDIVLIESIDNMHSPSVILNNLVEIGVKMHQDVISMNGSISQIQIGITEYDTYQKSGKVDTYILKPFEIIITAKINLPDCQHIDIVMTDIGLYISPSTVQILLSILSKLGSTPSENYNGMDERKFIEETNIFKPKPIDKKRYWFLNNTASSVIEATEDFKMEESLDDNNFLNTSFNTKQLIISISSVTVVIESGGVDSQPLIKLNSSYSIIMDNWSVINLYGTCFMDYYNEKNFIWEPIIEINESGCWSYNLKLDLFAGNESSQYISAFLESKQQLELTLSHSAICVINDLAELFTKAVKKPDSLKIEDNLLIFSNFMGMDLCLLINTKRFSHNRISNRVIDSNGIERIDIKPGDEFVMKSILNEKQNDPDTDIICEVSYCGEKIIRRVSLRERERRCYRFPLVSYPGTEYKWVVDKTSSDSSRSKRFIFGSLVEIENLFHVPLSLYYIDLSGNLEEYTFLVQIEPHSSFHLPVDVVYSKYKCVFVKPNDNYCTPKEAICWKSKHSKVFNDSFSTIVCESKINEPNFYLRVKCSAKKYLLEDSNRAHISCLGYKFEIHPLVRLRNLLPVQIDYTIMNIVNNTDGESKNMIKEETNCSLKAGETHNLYHINTKSNEVEVVVKNYLNQDWKCVNRIPHKWSKDNQIEIWTFTPINSIEEAFLDLAVDFLTRDESQMRTATLFAPFWMVNRTGLPLTYKVGENFIHHPSNLSGPILLCFKSKNFFSKKKLSLSIANSKFSDSFSIDAIGNQGNVITKDKEKISYCASVSIELSSFGLSKIVTISPFYSILNKSSFNVDVSEDKEAWIEVKSRSTQSLWPKDTKQCLLYIRLQINSSVSKPISLKDSSSLLLRIGNRIMSIHIDVTEYSVVVQLTNSFKGSAPVRIFNFLNDITVDYGQYLVSQRNRLPPMHSTYFTWHEPVITPRNLIWSTTASEEIFTELDHDALGKTEEGDIFWATFLDGKQRVLVITQDQNLAQNTLQSSELFKPSFEVELLLKGIGISMVNIDKRKEIAYIGITSSDVIWEVSRGRNKRYRPLAVKQIEAIESAYQKLILRERVSGTLKILKKEQKSRIVTLDNLKVDFHDFQEMKVLEPIKGFLRRNSAHGIWCTVALSPHMIQFHAKVNRVQIDNQMNDCVFNIIMCPVTPPRSLALDRAPKAFFEVSAIIQKQINMIRFKYITVLIQEFLIQIDGDFMMALFELAQYKKKPLTNYEKLIEDALIQVQDDSYNLSTDLTLSSKNYYDLIHFSPIKVHVSFSLGSADSIQLFGIFDFLIKSAGVTLTEFNNVLFKIDYFERKNILLSNSETVSLVVGHYFRQVLKQFYVIVLGLDVIGNPVGLLMGLKQGVGDFFYEPYMGIIQGPEEFAEGLALGIRSLFSYTVGGAAGALGKITGTLGDGISTLTMDQETRKKRRERMNRKTTLTQSGKDLVRGFFTGVTGIIMKPLRGAKQEGFEGLMKGVGRGVVGVVADPATGVIDFASGSLNALQRAIDINTEADKQRPTRHFQNDGILRPYNRHEANGKAILQDLQKHQMVINDNYFSHYSFPSESVVLMTDQRIIFLTPGCISKDLDIHWEESYDNIIAIEVNSNHHLLILLKEQRKRLKGLLGSKINRTIICPSPEAANWIVESINKAKKIRPPN